MRIHIKTTQLESTPSLETYIDRKLENISRLLKNIDKDGVAELWLEVGRTTRHHHKGLVFRAEADLKLPGKVLRAVEENIDIRTALDLMKDKLHLEIEKYKTKLIRRPRRVERRMGA